MLAKRIEHTTESLPPAKLNLLGAGVPCDDQLDLLRPQVPSALVISCAFCTGSIAVPCIGSALHLLDYLSRNLRETFLIYYLCIVFVREEIVIRHQ